MSSKTLRFSRSSGAYPSTRPAERLSKRTMACSSSRAIASELYSTRAWKRSPAAPVGGDTIGHIVQFGPMRKPVVLITGAGGEIGHALISRFASTDAQIITLDVNPLDATLAPLVSREFTGSITDTDLLDRVLAEFEVDRVFHLAALLSTRAEFTPITAHHVNVEGTINMLEFAQKQGESHGRPVTFMYPSSIATYGLPDRAAKAAAGRVREDQYAHPKTMYGCNKLYCEELGRYYARYYKQLSFDVTPRVDFRCVRFQIGRA